MQNKGTLTINWVANAIIAGDGKTSFYLKLADWIESWSTISNFCFSKQTANALILTLRSQALLIEELASVGVTPRIFPTFTIAQKQEELESSVLQWW